MENSSFLLQFLPKPLGLCWVSCLPLATETQRKATEVTGWDYKVKRNLNKMNKASCAILNRIKPPGVFMGIWSRYDCFSVAEIISKSLFFFYFYFISEHSLLAMLCEFQVYSKMLQLYIYMYLVFSKLFSHLGYYRIMSRVPCAIL